MSRHQLSLVRRYKRSPAQVSTIGRSLKPAARTRSQSYARKLYGHDPEMFEIYAESFRNHTQAKIADILAKKFEVSRSSIDYHARQYRWFERLEERNKLISQKTTEKVADKMARDNARLYDVLTGLEANVVNTIKSVDIKAGEFLHDKVIKNLAIAMDTIIKNKKLLAGEETEKIGFTFSDFMFSLVSAIEIKTQANNGIGIETVAQGNVGGLVTDTDPDTMLGTIINT